MKTTPEALKDLYVALGGTLANVANMSTNVEVLNAIAALYDGDEDASLNPDAIENIAAVADSLIVPTGKKTITENGTDIDVAEFEKVDVNVSGGGGGEGDFTVCTMTAVNNTGVNKEIFVANIIDDDEEDYHAINFDVYAYNHDTSTVQVVLYKGTALVMIQSEGATITVSGNIEDDGGGYYYITGDCTITIS